MEASQAKNATKTTSPARPSDDDGTRYHGARYGTVHDVISGDTLVIVGQKSKTASAASAVAAAPVMRLTLSSLVAPRMAHSAAEKEDEPYGFASREFLRKLCVGKLVQFKVEYSVASISRTFGWVRLMDPIKPSATLTQEQLSKLPVEQRYEFSENICVTVAREGWAKVREAGRDNEKSIDFDEMVEASKEAESNKKGVFGASEKGLRTVHWQPENAEEYFKANKGKTLRAIIEYVRDGSSMKLLMLSDMTVIGANLSGISCPRPASAPATASASSTTTATASASTSTPATASAPAVAQVPFSLEAKQFTEERLLKREVNIVIDGVDKFGNFFITVKHSAGNITVELLKQGYAKLVDWSINYLPAADAALLRATQKTAKEARKGIWHDYVATNDNISASSVLNETTYNGVIAEVVSGDTFIIRVPPASSTEFKDPQQVLFEAPWLCEERRISLSSVRAPKIGNKLRNDPEEPYGSQAKEYIRNNYVGKTCSVNIDYIRESNPTQNQDQSTSTGAAAQKLPPRKFATVKITPGDVNLALVMTQQGFTEVQKHKADDDRSPIYDQLIDAESTAKKQRKGRWSGKTPPADRTVELAGNPVKAKTHLSFLQQQPTHTAIVEHVLSATRMKVVIPSENCSLIFALAGITCPAFSVQSSQQQKQAENEPYGKEAYSLTRAYAHQQQVEVQIETMDRGGAAIGVMKVKSRTKASSNVNLAEVLLQKGVAKVNDFSASQSRAYQGLIDAEQDAIDKRLRLWKNYDEEKKKQEEEEAAAAAAAEAEGEEDNSQTLERVNATVTDIVDGSSLYIRIDSDEVKAREEEVQGHLEKFKEKFGTVGGNVLEMRSGQNCLALYDDETDGPAWYRCKVISMDKSLGRLRVCYLDHGNEGTVDIEKVRKAEDAPGLFAIPPLAIKCFLAFVKTPSLDSEFGNEAATLVHQKVWGHPIIALVHGKDMNAGTVIALRISIFPNAKEGETTVNEELLKNGYAFAHPVGLKPNSAKEEENEIIDKIVQAEEYAHKKHLNLWRYGDPRVEDEEDDGKSKSKKKGSKKAW